VFIKVRRIVRSEVAGAKTRRPLAKAIVAWLATPLVIAAGAVWLTSSTVAQSGGGGGSGAPVSSVKIGAAPLISPATANSFYGSDPTSTNSIAIAGQPIINSPPVEYLEVVRALDNDPDLIYAFVRNTVDTTFTYGVGKGGLGALIDRSGNAFDQAQLLVGLFRAADITAEYRVGTIQLTGAQFTAWTGISSASAACRLLANGGIPATVNGATVADCAYGSSAVSDVVLGHIWVMASIGGSNYVFDPSYKPYTVKTGAPSLATAAGLTPGNPLSTASSGAAVGTVGTGVPSIRSLNAANLATEISARAASLRAYVDANLPDGALSDLIGGRTIEPFVTPAGGLRQTALPYPTAVHRSWSGNVPNVYRASVNVAIAKQEIGVTGLTTVINHLLYVDDVYGRKLGLNTSFATNGSAHSGQLVVSGEFSGSVTIASYSRSGGAGAATSQNVNLNDGDITLTVNSPYAAAADGGAAGSYMDALIHKDVDFHLPLTIVTGWGESTAGLTSKWGSRNDAGMLKPQFPGGCETCGTTMPPTKGDGRRELIAATWMMQSSRAAALHAQIARATYQHHYSVGVVSADSWVNATTVTPSPTLRQDFSIADSADRVDIDTGFSVTSWNNEATTRRAAIHAISTTLATLEGSVIGQVADLPDVTSTATRFEWGNAPPASEDEAVPGTGARRFLRFDASNSSQALSLAWVEGQQTNSVSGNHNGTAVGPLTNGEVVGRRIRLADAITAYTAAGFRVTASEDSFLGPGQRGGYFDERPPFMYAHRYSMQRGGAFVATRTDVSGEPLEIAHVTVGPYRNSKGGGGGADVNTPAHYDPAKMADLLTDPFVDRSGAAGVDLSSGAPSYTSPANLTVGQGDFPYSLSANVAWRGGQRGQFDGFAPVSTIAPNGPITTNWNNQLSISSSATDTMAEKDVRASLGTVAAFLVMQDIYASSAPTEADAGRRDVVALLSAAWWAKHVTSNVATVTLGTSSTQFLRRSDGQWFVPGAPGSASITQVGARTPYAKYMGCGDGSVTYVTSRGWNYNGMSFQVRGSDGDIQTFQNWEEQTSDCRTVRGFRMTGWSFPTGVNLTLTYGTPAGEVLQRLLEVRNNLGLEIDFIDGGSGGFRDGLNPSRQVIINRDPLLKPLSVTDAAGATYRFDYTFTGYQRHRLDAVYMPGRPTVASLAYTYDTLGRVKDARDALAVAGQRSQHEFFIVENFRGMRKDPAGGRFRVGYDRQGHPISTTDEEGRTALATFDGRGRVKTRTTAWGDKTAFEYDQRGNVTKVTRSPRDGCGTDTLYWCQTSIVTATYHATWNKPLSITLPATVDGQAAHTWTFAYNSAGQVITQTSPSVSNGGPGGGTAPAIWQTQYNDTYGRPTRTIDPTGIATAMEYGTNGQAVWCMSRSTFAAQSIALAQPTNFTCDTVGNVVSTTDALSRTSTATWDILRRKTGEYGPTSTAIKIEWEYDIDGNQTLERRWDNSANVWRTTTTTWSLTAKPLTVTDPSGDVIRTCYDPLDREVITVDPTGRASRTTYNLAGQPMLIERWFTASTSDASCALTQARPAHFTTNRWRALEYNTGGLQSAEVDGNGNSTTFTYDGLGRQMLTTFADTTYIQTLRNERDQVYLTFKRGGDIHQAYYDPLGRVNRVWEHAAGSAGLPYPYGRHTMTGYDLASRPTTTMVSNQTTTAGVYNTALERDVRTYLYDAAGRVIEDRIKPNDAVMGSAELTLKYDYDKANNRTMIEWPDLYRATYRFDAANRADRVQFGPGAAPTTHQADITYDSLGRRTGLNRSNGANSSWTYETDDDLSGINHAWVSGSSQLPATYGFQRDAVGRLTMTTTNQAVLEWMPTLAEARTYGTPNNLNQLPSANGVGMTWDPNGNLDSYGTTNYVWTWGNRLAEVRTPTSDTYYAYDALDRRTWMKEDNVVTRTLWSADDEVGDYADNGTILRRYVPDGSGAMDARLAVITAAGTVSWFHADNLGSVIAMTNGAGQPIQFANYSPHGKFGTDQNGITYSAPPGGSPFGYTGRRWDAKAQLYQYRARYYSPELGIFLSTDPIGTKDDPNLYMYVGLDPANATDPTGKQSVIYHTGDLRTAAESVPHPRGWAIVQAHGWEDGRIMGSDGNPISSASILRDLNAAGYRRGTPIILLVCNAGHGREDGAESTASALSRRADAPVFAALGFVRVPTLPVTEGRTHRFSTNTGRNRSGEDTVFEVIGGASGGNNLRSATYSSRTESWRFEWSSVSTGSRIPRTTYSTAKIRKKDEN